jgi:Flp pilus assembly protein TadG
MNARSYCHVRFFTRLLSRNGAAAIEFAIVAPLFFL